MKSQINAAALAAATLAAVLVLLTLPGPFAWLSSIAGLVLLLILLAYDQEGSRSVFQSIAFSGVCGFCLMLALRIVYRLVMARQGVAATDDRLASEWLPVTWLCATFLFAIIDRLRMSGREAAEAPRSTAFLRLEQRPAAQTAASGIQRTQQRVTFEPEREVAATEHRSRAVSLDHALATAAAAGSGPMPQAAEEANNLEALSTEQASAPEPVAAAAPSIPAQPAAVPPEPAPTLAPAQPPPTAVPARAGKPATIYVNLVGEGIACLRSVGAEHMGRDFYKITEPTPEGEMWEFQAGQIVRCKKRKLSSGKALVAVEEAPRAQ